MRVQSVSSVQFRSAFIVISYSIYCCIALYFIFYLLLSGVVKIYAYLLIYTLIRHIQLTQHIHNTLYSLKQLKVWLEEDGEASTSKANESAMEKLKQAKQSHEQFVKKKDG